jgi:uncharacterized membrane protein HdeD (DUF308 family)
MKEMINNMNLGWVTGVVPVTVGICILVRPIMDLWLDLIFGLTLILSGALLGFLSTRVVGYHDKPIERHTL